MLKPMSLGLAGLCLIAATSAHAEREIDLRSVIREGGIQIGGAPLQQSNAVQRRVAYVIGNNDYEHVPDLKNAEKDARLIAEFFRSEGYSVSEHYGIDKAEFEAVLRKIARETDENTNVVIYFAGHGIQIGEVNYLIPTDARLENSAEVGLEAVSLSNIMEIAKSRSRTLVVFLDSCRDNPFEGRQLRQSLAGSAIEAEGGFFAQQAPINSFLSFSTSPGMFAEDGTGDNSPFTDALVSVASENRSERIESIMQEVRRRVYETTGQRQVPWESTSLVDEFFLANPELAEPLVLIAEAETEPQPEKVVQIDVALDKTVNIGEAISNALGTAPDLQVEVLGLPSLGRIEGSTGVSGQSFVAYRPSLDSLPALQTPTRDGAPQIDDRFVVAVADQIVEVQMSSEVNDCDYEAGDHLDANGVGISRYPNELRPEVALAACLQAVDDNPEVGRFHYQLGRAYTALRKLDEAEAAFEEARKLGHDRAYYALGSTALGRIQEVSGRLRELAPPEVLAYYAAGAERGDPYAIHALGRQYLLYSDDPVRQEEGFRLLIRAAEMGHTFAMNALGQFFLDDDRATFDGARGLEYWKVSASRNDIYGFNNMGTAYSRGLGGLEPNLELAVDFFKKASDGGHPSAPVSLGVAYVTGKGAAQNVNAALEQFDRALARGNGRGGTNGALLFLSGRIKAGPGEAAKRSAKAVHLNNRRAAEQASEQLGKMSKREIDAGAQAIMVELGASITVDGAFGPGSRAALAELEQTYGVSIEGNSKERLLALAKLYWQNNKLRVDLY